MRLTSCLVLWLAFAVSCQADEPARPNIVLMMADDLGWGDVGYNGSRSIKTPHLDQMSRDGIRFNRFYAGCSVCSPTRASCLTGRNPFRQGVYSANVGHLKDQEICLAEVLQKRGYTTGHFGKWHLGTLAPDYSGRGPGRKPEEHYSTPGMNGFDSWFSTEYAVATWDPYAPENAHLKRRPWDPRRLYWLNGVNVTEPLSGDDSRIIMDRAIDFIDDAVKQSKPFLSVIWFHAPHEPVVGGPEYRAMYPQYSEEEQHYYATVTALDEQVGRLRRQLSEIGVADDTMVWFCSDNGPEGNPGPRGRSQGSAGNLRGRKRSLYEGGIRVPGLLVWPQQIKQPREVDTPVVTSDYFPTVLDILRIPQPDGRPYDGISLLPLIAGQAQQRTNDIGFQFGKQAALIGDRFKLVHNTALRRGRSDNGDVPWAEWELYDLIDDPGETTNIIELHAEQAQRMKEQLAAWQASCQASDSGEDYVD